MSTQESETFTSKLNRFEVQNNLPTLKVTEDLVSKYFTMDPESLAGLPKKELAELAFTLSRFNIHLSDAQATNAAKAGAIKKWLDRELVRLSCGFNGFTLEERKTHALNADPYLVEMHDKLIEYEMFSERIRPVVFQVEGFLKRIDSLLRVRSFNE